MQVRGYNCVRRDVDGDTSPTGGVCLFTSNLFPSNVVTLHTSLQAVAVRIHVHSLVTVCCVYLPPNDVVPQVDLNRLVSQLPAPFILLGDFNGHSPLWGHDVTNSRGRQIEQLISDHCLCLLNNDEKTYFHAPTRTFHSLDLAICSPALLPMLNFEVANDLHNSDHFPLQVSHVNGAGTRFRPPTYDFHRGDWALPRCPSDLFLLPRGLLSLVNTGFTNPGNPSDPSLFSALFLAISISLFFFSRQDHRPTLDNGHCPNLILF
ncbi:uncharacterized protein TNCV_3646451 [Trichonephila clavipes]|nr:uncharacterized protein TNCV_3646451 [Trichonephila clavipes]